MTSRGLEILSTGECLDQLRSRSCDPGPGDAVNLEPWVAEGLDFVVHIRTRTISGRRLLAR